MSEASERLRADIDNPEMMTHYLRNSITAVLDERDAYRAELERLLSVISEQDYEIVKNMLEARGFYPGWAHVTQGKLA